MTAILDEFKLSYVAVPKVACTSIKTMLFEVENGFAFQHFSASGRSFWIHDFYKSVPFGDLKHAAMADHRRLAVVRDPVRRLLSCYSNRVLHHRELSRDKARKPLRTADLPFNPDLPTFVAHLEGYMAAVDSIRHHALPMVAYLGHDPAYYARVFGMSELDAFVEEVRVASGREVALGRLQTGGPKIDPEALSAAETRRLQAFYAEDYALYGDRF